MSLIDQAKREAKRLFKLAQTYKEIDNTPHLPIKSLTEAKNHVAFMNGYNNWHDYEENLRRKDFVYENVDVSKSRGLTKISLENKEYFLQELDFKINEFTRVKDSFINTNKTSEPVVVGRKVLKKFDPNVLRKADDKIEKPWQLNNYPALYSGYIGSGKAQTLLSVAYQHIKQGEGVIYIDSSGDNVLYTKFFSACEQYNRLEDLFTICFMLGSGEPIPNKKYGNSFDPINSIIGEEIAWESLFGNNIGKLLHKIAMVAKYKNWLLDAYSLKCMLMLPNLIKWANNSYWENATSDIKQYLQGIGYKEEGSEEDYNLLIQNHALQCQNLEDIITLMEKYYKFQVFSICPEIDMEQVFKQNQILLVLNTALEKSSAEYIFVANLVNVQVAFYAEKLAKENIVQNIFMDEVVQYIPDNLAQYFNAAITKDSKWVFGVYDWEYTDRKIFKYILPKIGTYVLMKSHVSNNDIPAELRLSIMDNIENIPPIFHKHPNINPEKYWVKLNELEVGEAYIYSYNINNINKKYINYENKWYLEKIKCEYNYLKTSSYFKLNRVKSNIILK